MSSESLPKTMRAVKFQSKGKAAVENNVSVPSLRPDYVLVKTRAIALNPTDWKHIDYVTQKKATMLCDFAGDVVAVGEDVTKDWKVGDRICGMAHGGNDAQTEDGAGGDYLVAKADIQFKIPEGMSYEDASTVGISFTTIGHSFYYELGLPWPGQETKEAEKKAILIYGGSTATGANAIQFAKLSGLEVHATCSPSNFDYVKSLGATHVYDYNSPTCGADIRSATNNSLRYAYDTIANAGTLKICLDALASEPDSAGGKPKYCCLMPQKDFPSEKAEYHYTFAYQSVGEPFSKAHMGDFKAKPELFEHAKEVAKRADVLLKNGDLKPIKTDVRDGGLDALLSALDELRQGKVSGKKIVVKIS